MIAYLNGTVKAKTENAIILETSGIGYLIFPTNDLLMKAREGKTLELYVYTIVREQEISLYGFRDLRERSFFELLLTVSGVGPKTALEFFSLPITHIQDAISTGDSAFIGKIKGIGKKTAERIVVELKSKIGNVVITETLVIKETEKDGNEEKEDVILALEGLGYERMHIVKHLQKAPEFDTAEQAITWFLQQQSRTF